MQCELLSYRGFCPEHGTKKKQKQKTTQNTNTEIEKVYTYQKYLDTSVLVSVLTAA